MTAKEIERDLKAYCNGASFIRPGELAMCMGYVRTKKDGSRVGRTDKVKKFLIGAGKPTGAALYFIPDVAKNIYMADTCWEEQ